MLHITDQLKRATGRTQHLQRGVACYKKNCHTTKEGRCLYGAVTTAVKQMRQVEHTHTHTASVPAYGGASPSPGIPASAKLDFLQLLVSGNT